MPYVDWGGCGLGEWGSPFSSGHV